MMPHLPVMHIFPVKNQDLSKNVHSYEQNCREK